MKRLFYLMTTIITALVVSGCMRLSVDFEMGTTDVMAVSRTKAESVENKYDGKASSVEFIGKASPIVKDVVDKVTPLPDRPVVVAPPEGSAPDAPVVVIPPENQAPEEKSDIDKAIEEAIEELEREG